MCLSTFFAFVVGAYLLITSLATIIHQARYKKICADMLADGALVCLTGCIQLVFGLIIVATHNYWVSDWPLLITLIGWAALIQGAWKLLAPEHCVKMCKQWHGNSGYYLVNWIWMLIGLYLVWVAFATAQAETMTR